MNPSLLVLSTYLPAVAWAGQALDDAVDALVHVTPRTARIAVPSDTTDHPVATASGPIARLLRHIGQGSQTTGALLSSLVGLLRELAGEPGAEALPAAEILALLPTSPGDFSAVPDHAEIRRSMQEHSGAVYVRHPSSRSAVLVHCDHSASQDIARWTVVPIVDAPMAPQAESVARAAAALTDAVHGAARIIAASRGGAPQMRGTTDAVGGLIGAAPALRFPDIMAAREIDLLSRADTIEDIRRLANRAEHMTGAGAAQQPQLWALQSAIHTARRAAVSAFAQRTWELAGSAACR